ncbi:MAG: winged helix-turn-helix domain-containing protein [Candidatus Bathyarchaeota archaeon]|nr:winged helix-turn-helix domain-containing protein [Candidatus Bathyarchaeota archaeon]
MHRERKVLKRGWDSITIDLLAAALQPEKRMRIMYKANLNFDRFKRYFYDLLEKGFIEKMEDNDGHAFYKTSERGKTLLAALRKAHDLANLDAP